MDEVDYDDIIIVLYIFGITWIGSIFTPRSWLNSEALLDSGMPPPVTYEWDSCFSHMRIGWVNKTIPLNKDQVLQCTYHLSETDMGSSDNLQWEEVRWLSKFRSRQILISKSRSFWIIRQRVERMYENH